MMLIIVVTILANVGIAAAQRSQNVSICDYYTPIVTGKENSAASQYELMLTITHTFILGNYTQPNVGVKVAGIAAPATFDGHEVYLLPYFTGGYASTNLGTGKGVAYNWLDSGAATALLANMPANSADSHQYQLLTHVYQYFGVFYGCSMQGTPDFPSYQGAASMYRVHRYMDINKYEMGFFNQQIALAGKSLGFEQADVDFTLQSLEKVFSHRCTPAATVIPPEVGANLQTICTAAECPLDPNATCSAYPDGGLGQYPIIVNETLIGGVPKENDTAPTSPSGTANSIPAAASASSSGGAGSNKWVHTGGVLTWLVVLMFVAGLFAFPV